MKTITVISRVARDVNNTSSLVLLPSHLSGCQRCGGMLVNEHCLDVGEEGNGHTFWGMRCIQCGDVIDETILRNRFASVETLKELRSHTKSGTIVQAIATIANEQEEEWVS